MKARSIFRVVSWSFLALALTVFAQQPAKVPVIGILVVWSDPKDSFVTTVKEGLSAYGYIDGASIRIERRAAQYQLDRLPQLANELVALGADIIVVGTEPVARAAMQASSTVPIVIVGADHDPVASGLIDSFNRPSGNVTGIYTRDSELVGKRLELLKDASPGISRVAVFWDSLSARQLDELEPAARVLKLKIERIELRGTYDYAAAFKVAKKKKAGAVLVLFSPRFTTERIQMAALALESRMPTIYQNETSVKAGGLMSYGPTLPEMIRRSAYYIDRLLKGANRLISTGTGSPTGRSCRVM